MSGVKKRPVAKRPSRADSGAGPVAKRQREGSAGGVEKQSAQRKLELAQDAQSTAQTQQHIAVLEEKIKQAEEKALAASTRAKQAEEKVKQAKEETEAAHLGWQRGLSFAPRVQQVTATDLDITTCARPADVNVERQGLVKLADCVESCMSEIDQRLPEQTSAAGIRVSPTMLSRCMRGGKTTVLCKVFDELKKKGKNPIFISFNSDTVIHKLVRETPLDTLLRAIAVALMRKKPKDSDEASTVCCDKSTLKNFLKDVKDVILLVDELNVLLKPSDTQDYEEVGLFLRQTFLDPKGRHLVFSTHVPCTAGLDKLLGRGSGSSRDPVAIDMPKSRCMSELVGMADECQALTPCEVAYYSYIPSLLCTMKTQPSYNFQARFQTIAKPRDSGEKVLRDFLKEFFDGRLEDTQSPIRAFDSLTEFSNGQVRWVLGYAGLLLHYLGIHSVARWIERLKDLAVNVRSGLDWEEIVKIALALRCIQAKFDAPHDLLKLPDFAPKPVGVTVKTVPNEHCKKPEDMLTWWKERTVSAYPYIAVLSPASAITEVIDVMWVYQEHASSEHIVRGIQHKLSTELPNKDMPENMLGLLFRGSAPGSSKGSTKRKGWEYPTDTDICGFLGVSLQGMYPAHWAPPEQ